MTSHTLDRNNKRFSGFTIVELLIVIVVIGILAAIVTIAYANVARNARDAGRIAKVKEISKAIERYYIDNGRYPAVQDATGTETAVGTCGSTANNYGHCDRNEHLTSALEPYIRIDPTSLSAAAPDAIGENYYYNSATGLPAPNTGDDHQTYGLMIYLEGSGGQNDGGYYPTAYELGSAVAFCMKNYTGIDRAWRWTSGSPICRGGNGV